MSFQLELECGECRRCPASSWHIEKCLRDREEAENQIIESMIVAQELEDINGEG